MSDTSSVMSWIIFLFVVSLTIAMFLGINTERFRWFLILLCIFFILPLLIFLAVYIGMRTTNESFENECQDCPDLPIPVA